MWKCVLLFYLLECIVKCKYILEMFQMIEKLHEFVIRWKHGKAYQKVDELKASLKIRQCLIEV